MRILFLSAILFQFTVISLLCQTGLIHKPINNQIGSIFRINKIIPNEQDKSLYIYLTASYRSTTDFFEKDADLFTVKELKKSPFDSLRVIEFPNTKLQDQKITTKLEKTTILVLVDFSGSMLEEDGLKLQKAKEALYTLMTNPKLKSFDKKFAYFHDIVGDTYTLNDQYIQRIYAANSSPLFDTDLHRAIFEKLDELARIEGNKILILLTDGKNDIDEKYYDRNGLSPISEKEVYQKAISLDSSFQIISMGIGNKANESFLDSLSKCTPNPNDFYLFGTRPTQIVEDLQFISESVLSNLVLRVRPDPNHCIFGNETREFQVTYKRDSNNIFIAKKSEIFSTGFKSYDLSQYGNIPAWIPFVVGIFLVVLMLLYFIWIIPILIARTFRKKNIRQYFEVKKPNVVTRDPLTMQPIADHEEVVVMDNKVMLYETWKYVMNQGEGGLSTTHAEFFKAQTKGNFFDQKGSYRQLNWVWYGALGGLIAWMLSFVFKLDWNHWTWFQKLLSTDDSLGEKLYQSTFFGLSLGLSFLLCLALVEELGQSRKFSFWRIIVRVIIGGVLGAMAIFTSKWLIYQSIETNIPSYFRDLLDWILFGIVMGCALPIFSSIRFKIGLIAGIFASLVAFHIFSLLQVIQAARFLGQDLTLVIGLIIYGSVIGYLIHTVVQRFEDFELQVLSPKEFFGQTRPVSKFLKGGQYPYVTIGVHPSCEVYVKWPDEVVCNKHARMSYQKGVVYIEPAEGPVYINGNIANGKTQLKNMDKIQLGPQSVTLFQFMAKEEQVKTNEVETGSFKKSINPKLQNRNQTESNPLPSNPEIRKQIKITPRKKT